MKLTLYCKLHHEDKNVGKIHRDLSQPAKVTRLLKNKTHLYRSCDNWQLPPSRSS